MIKWLNGLEVNWILTSQRSWIFSLISSLERKEDKWKPIWIYEFVKFPVPIHLYPRTKKSFISKKASVMVSCTWSASLLSTTRVSAKIKQPIVIMYHSHMRDYGICPFASSTDTMISNSLDYLNKRLSFFRFLTLSETVIMFLFPSIYYLSVIVSDVHWIFIFDDKCMFWNSRY